MGRGLLTLAAVAVLAAAAFACSAAARTRDWAAPQVATITRLGILGTSRAAAAFRPNDPLTQGALAAAVAAAAAAQTRPAPPAPPPAPVTLTATFGDGAVLSGIEPLVVDAPGQAIDHVDFAVDGTGVATADEPPFEFDLDTTRLSSGAHRLAINAWFAGGGHAISVFGVTVENDGSAAPTPAGAVSLPIARATLPAAQVAAAAPTLVRTLYRTATPDAPVTMKKLDAALVSYLGLLPAARKISSTLAAAGLRPPPNTGTEAVARMLRLRLNHPAAEDGLELLPNQAATRAEAAYSFARLLELDPSSLAAVQQAADSFTLPAFTPWQQRILTTAVHYVGYPYVWGGTSPTAQAPFGVRSVGGFDCSGFVWRVYKLTAYPGEGDLARVLRGRTTYQMSGEVGRRLRVAAADLQPADVMFFGAAGRRSKPDVVDHTALYLGNGWFIQSSDEGVTVLPFAGGYPDSFAWARRPLSEAGLSG